MTRPRGRRTGVRVEGKRLGEVDEQAPRVLVFGPPEDEPNAGPTVSPLKHTPASQLVERDAL